MKRIISLLLTICLVFSMAACGKDNTGSDTPDTSGTPNTEADAGTDNPETDVKALTPQDFDTFKIGVVEAQANDETVARRDYYENYIAPHYNVEFIFSEVISSAEDELNFIENCADAGCSAIMDYNGSYCAQMVQVCAEYDMYYLSQGVSDVAIYDYDNFVGSGGASTQAVADIFSEWIAENASEDGSEGFIINSGLTYAGNIQHEECTKAVLEALSSRYGLTYDAKVEDLMASSAPIEATNDKGISIYIYPGAVQLDEGFLPGITSALQSGKYGVLILCTPAYSNTAVIVDEIEQSFKMDIKVMGVASVSSNLETAFATMDSFGNPSLDMAAVKMNSPVCGAFFAKVYNALTGYKELCVNPAAAGEQFNFNFNPWAAVTSSEELSELTTWDVAGGKNWIMDYDTIDSLLGIYNPDLTVEEMDALIGSISLENAQNR